MGGIIGAHARREETLTAQFNELQRQGCVRSWRMTPGDKKNRKGWIVRTPAGVELSLTTREAEIWVGGVHTGRIYGDGRTEPALNNVARPEIAHRASGGGPATAEDDIAEGGNW